MTFIQLLKQNKYLLGFTLLYLIPFTISYVSKGNGEFIWYAMIVVALFLLVIGTLPKSGFSQGILWGLSVWALLHLAGGGIKAGASVLYDLVLIPLYNGGGEMILLKYDQAVHAYGFGICALIILHFLKRQVTDPHKKSVYIISALGGMGLGVVNEIAEFIAVILFPNNGVGGYVNTSLDLVFNTIGAVIAVVIAYQINKNKIQ